MRQTLFFIPHEIAGVQVFGFGWLLLFWLTGSFVLVLFLMRKHGWTPETRGFLPFIGIVALAIAFVLPRVEVGAQGLPIRGYGVMLLAATVLGVLLAVRRAKQVGLPPEVILSLAFHMFVGGIVGARLFFIIQYWDVIHVPGSLTATLGNMVNFVEGGLVVYGSLIGALLAAMWFVHGHQLPPLAIADLIAPSLALGLAIGRIGCLMNGCCYGGVSDHIWAVTFPGGSPPYYDQHRAGLFYGFRLGSDDGGRPIVAEIVPGGSAARSNVPAGVLIRAVNQQPVKTLDEVRVRLGQSQDEVSLTTDQGTFRWSIGALPTRSLPVHPTQIYSSINAAVLCLLAYAYFPFRRRDGEVFALLMGLYAITRFMLEVIRTDEGSLWNTGMTISQNVSILMLVGVVGLLWFISRQPRQLYWPQLQG